MFKKIISIQTLAFVLLLLVAHAKAQTKITGTVKNKNNAAVPYASVKVKGTTDGVITDTTGQFSFTTNASGKQILTVTSIGYTQYSKSVAIQENDLQLNIILEKEEQQLQGIVVNAGGFEASDKATGASLTPMDVFTVAGNNADLEQPQGGLPYWGKKECEVLLAKQQINT